MGIKDVLYFDYIDPPPPIAIQRAIESLLDLEAINNNFNLTQTGKSMNKIPVDCELARILIKSSELNCSQQILTIIAMLEVENIFAPKLNENFEETNENVSAPFSHPDIKSDIIVLLNVCDEYIKGGFISMLSFIF